MYVILTNIEIDDTLLVVLCDAGLDSYIDDLSLGG